MHERYEEILISFGMIVLNGEPFVKYSLSSIYPFAHQIIVVEGACPSSASVARPDGHSTDGTLELLYRFKRDLDPENKLLIVTAKDEGYADGFWPEKDEMSGAYAKRATGNYLWQIDSDEFYHEKQLARLMDILRTKRPDMVSFPMITFWGSPDYLVNGFYFIRDKRDQIPRLFAWCPNYIYSTHRPATVLDEQGTDLRKKYWLRASDLRHMRIYMYHYSLLFPHQVLKKVVYYKNRLNNCVDTWEESVYLRMEKPFRAHNVYQFISWIERYTGEHPAAIRALMADIQNQKVSITLRDCADIENLISKRYYKIATAILRVFAYTMAVQPFYFFYRAYASIKFRLNNYLSSLEGEKLYQVVWSVLIKLRDGAFKLIRLDRISLTKIRIRKDLKHIGTKYGGWIVPFSLFDSGSICYCIGCGEDISFDLGLIEAFGCHVFAFDPTPRAIEHVRKVARQNLRYHFSDLGLWDKDDRLKFYAPKNDKHVSYSLLNLQKTENYIEVMVKRLSQIMKENGHQKIDLLKIDIEGAEYKVLDSIFEDNIDIRAICVEYDEYYHPIDDKFKTRIRSSVKSLIANGYTMVCSQGNASYTFLKEVSL